MNASDLPQQRDGTRERLKERLENLRQEYQAGEAQLRALEQRSRELQQTMLRIGGAIQVLDELLGEEQVYEGA
ncbi:hypothetical protein FNU76_17515 [Chitinimonas arctica]|uniref:Uncharacterized protein n=1 Tax=Chitinimonas arctica TaxID=2594795 RepID=A0A516SIL8_9NEIS|nr:hypothetical protein [Chitinimonas arctica]QDQ27999.1 hypothetical protein FNU76_17515 [Chitinimonas arctica]